MMTPDDRYLDRAGPSTEPRGGRDALRLPTALVQKYGGSSVATPERISSVADRIAGAARDRTPIAVVVSAMGKTTDQLLALARQVNSRPHGRELDLLLATGEQVAVAMLALALQERQVSAVALTAHQCGIRTDRTFNRARIRAVEGRRLRRELADGRVVIVAGFQGVTEDDDFTTLGRGGGDVTGAAVAAALGARVYENYTDVDGVYSADPTIVGGARRLAVLNFLHALELSGSGAKILHPRAVEICMDHRIPIHVRSSFAAGAGTWIEGGHPTMEEAAVVGVSSDANVLKVLFEGIPDHPGSAARIFRELASAHVNARLMVQGAGVQGFAHMTFVIAGEAMDAMPDVIDRLCRDRVISQGQVTRSVATVSIVGSRLASELAVAGRMFQALAKEGVNVECISASDTKIACLVAESDRERAVRAVHAEFLEELTRFARGFDHVV